MDACDARATATLPAVVVTGASEGIGREIAKCFAMAGRATLLLVARDGARLETLAAELRRDFGADAAVQALDLLDPSASEKIEVRLMEKGWHAEVLVNNAGVGLSGDFCSHAPEKIESLLALNMQVPVRLTRQFLPQMCARGSGGVLNIASLGGYVPGPGQAVYYASKAFLISFSKSIRQEVDGTGVRVTVVAPGPVATRFHTEMDAGESRYRRLLPHARVERVAWAAVTGFKWNMAVVFPGLASSMLVLVTRFTPNFLLAPIMGWLLGRRASKP